MRNLQFHLSIFVLAALAHTAPAAPAPLKALLIAGGCCHDYAAQTRIISEGLQKRGNIRVDVYWTRDDSHDPPLPLFKKPDWAKAYDVIIHDECAALKKDKTELTNILNAHKTVPAVHLHCAIHSFRGSDNQWHEHIGLSSDRHGPHVPVSVKIDDTQHPIMKPFENWVTGKEELYNNAEIYGAKALATGTQTYKKGGKNVTESAIVIWTNEQYGAPSFSTSLGHFNHTVEGPRYLKLITRGLLWTCEKLDQPDYHIPYTGPNTITEIPAKPLRTIVKAKSTQDGHPPHHAIDSDPETRWCGNGPEMPAWLQLELDRPATLTGVEIDWEIPGQWMQYTIETSRDGKKWTKAADASMNQETGMRRDSFRAHARFIRLTILKQQRDMWPSIREIRLLGPTGGPLRLAPK